MDTSRPFFSRVDSLRILGALAVAGYHLSGWNLNGVALFPHTPWPHVGDWQNFVGRLALAFFPGRSALMMFFVISGLVLYVSLQYGPQNIVAAARRFFTARIFRIYPIVVFGTALSAAIHGGHLPPSAGGAPLTVTTFFAHCLLLDVSANPTLWALQVEVLAAPVIVAVFFMERRFGSTAIAALAIATTALSFSGHWALWPPFSHHIYAFIVGMLVPTFGRQFVGKLSRGACGGVLLAALAGLFLPGPLLGIYSQWSALFETYAAFTLVALVAYRADTPGTHWLNWTPINRVGLAAGSYYVLHVPLLPWALALVGAGIPMAWSVAAPMPVGFLATILTLGLIVPAALVSFRFIEAPGIALGRRIIRRRALTKA